MELLEIIGLITIVLMAIEIGIQIGNQKKVTACVQS